MERTIDDLVETVGASKARGRGSTLLIGAGCSVTAGVPTAAGFVDLIKDRFPSAFSRAEGETYAKCMAQLSPGERQELIGEFVSEARLNWAHIAIAQLMKSGFVDRVLTTNFDLLVARACALLGHFPAIYDFAASQRFKPAQIPDSSVFYLHGQSTGFVLMNTDVEVSEHSERLAPVFEDAGTGRPWLVAGYSGSNDPVFDHLANVDVFDYQLYWAGYKNAPPPAHVRDRLIKEGKYAFYLPGHDADSLFVTLAQKLGCFPPELFSRPFSFLDDQIADIAEYPIPDQDDELDIPGDTRRRIRAAIDRYERGVEDAETGLADVSRLARASRALMAGNYDDVIKAYVSASDDQKTELADVAASAYLFRATTLAQQARNEGNEGDRLFKRSYEEYARAVEIKPDKHEAFNNWGNTLLSQARRKERAEGDLLFAESYEKYARAVEIKPDYHEAFYNWGNALSYQARRKEGAEGDRLFEESYEKYARALEIKPDYHEAFESWSATLVNHGVREEGEEAVLLLEQATDRALSAEQLMAGSGAYNLACISARLGKVDEAKMWLHQSLETGFLPSRNHLSEDDDLDAVREEPWFAEILAGSETGPA